MDVFEDEPLTADARILTMGDKVLLSPHMVSSNLRGGLHPGLIWATQRVLEALRGETPISIYNKDVIPTWEQRYTAKNILP